MMALHNLSIRSKLLLILLLPILSLLYFALSGIVERQRTYAEMQRLEGLAELGDREIVPILVRQMEGEAGDDLFWLATIDAAKAIALPALVPHLQAYRAALAESHAADFSWLPWVDEAIAACSAPTDSASGP